MFPISFLSLTSDTLHGIFYKSVVQPDKLGRHFYLDLPEIRQFSSPPVFPLVGT